MLLLQGKLLLGFSQAVLVSVLGNCALFGDLRRWGGVVVGPNLGLDLVHSHENVASPAGPAWHVTGSFGNVNFKLDCRVICTPAIFGCSLAEIFKWLKFGVWNETLQVCMRPIPKINFFGDRHDDTHCWGSRDCQFGFGFLALHDRMGDSVFCIQVGSMICTSASKQIPWVS